MTGGLDREVKNKYTLQISAIDGGTVPGPLEGHTKVTITISDSNDNSPVFQTRPLVFSVLENESIGTFVGKAEASDIDQGDNSVIKYFINESGKIYICTIENFSLLLLKSMQNIFKISSAVYLFMKEMSVL